MCEFREEGGAPFIRRKEEANPTSNICGIAYLEKATVSKVIANRLKSILPIVISESQNAFILGRLITDNIMIAFELCHHLKRKSLGKYGSMALKIDMLKAYDRVEWNFFTTYNAKFGISSKLCRSHYAMCAFISLCH